jgi:hypothetical protein
MAQSWSTSWPRIVAKAWADAEFQKKLIADPAAVAAAEGLPVIPGLQIKVEQGGSQATLTLPLPKKPDNLSTNDLGKLASAGMTASGSCSQTCCC